MEISQINEVTRRVIDKLTEMAHTPYVQVGVSNRHIHLCKEDCDLLFGYGHQLTPIKELLPGQYACAETLTIIGKKGEIEKVRVLGPLRTETQIEISLTDSFKLGTSTPLKVSGDTSNSASIILEGPNGRVAKQEGMIVALCHIHMPPNFAEKFGFYDKQVVSVEFTGVRPIVFKNVLLRISKDFTLEMHIDTDEANAGFIQNGALGKIIV